MAVLVGFASIAFEHRIGALNFFLLFFKSRVQRFEMASGTTILLSYKMPIVNTTVQGCRVEFAAYGAFDPNGLSIVHLLAFSLPFSLSFSSTPIQAP